ncbi:MerR family DNA-binding protein [Streptomyces gobiensis]|uniref:MerR family DNA-binding protein n=1 Tax=Streptomyces gobiensis TaxID=2875706 RepID=UPI001E5E81AF|nr:MerR family transcriptional regulator [Streptomyces gobiensis]UGY91263.1 MerR family DNA-binding protein [Streptomyces gobiensis]
MAGVTVGKAAELAGVSRKAIRLWEAKGLLPQADRTEAGYRLFDQADLEVLRFVRRARALGLTLDEINDILDLQRGGAQPCGRVTQMLDAHLDQINRTLSELRQLRRSLIAARRTAETARRSGGDAVVCQIIETGPASGQ